jgi:tRNA pseudouridine38-40 synthase
MATKNFKLVIEYDGSAYCGWQRQPNGPTIQACIEEALERMTRSHIKLIGSGRTDAGVHALGQCANFACDTAIDAQAFRNGLNSLLPDDIVIRSCEEVHAGFHARFDVQSKTYRYRILNSPLPAAIGRQYQWWIRTPLDVAAMREAAGYLIGEKDFKAFEAAGSPRAHTIRHVMRAELRREDESHLIFEIRAQGFLRYMVRNITGTLVQVGKGQLAPREVAVILDTRDRSQAGMTAPAHGLCLVEVFY